MSKRRWIDTPANIEVTTPYGPAFLAVTQGDHIHVDSSSNGKFLNYTNGSEYTASIHLNLVDGKWAITSIYSSNRTAAQKGNYNAPVPPSHLKKIVDAMYVAAVAYVVDRPNVLAKAQDAHLNNSLLRIEDEIAELREKTEKLQEKRLELLRSRGDIFVSTQGAT